MNIRFSIRHAVAWYLGEDLAQIEHDRRYQSTRTPCPVYTHGNDYLTATHGNRKPKGDADYHWVRVTTDTLPPGWNIWKHADES